MLDLKTSGIHENNGDIKKAIEFKVKNITNLPIEIKTKKGELVKDVMLMSKIKNPFLNVFFNDVLENYFYGLFYDGMVYLILTDKYFYIARKDGIKKTKNNKYKFNGEYVEVFEIKNINPANNQITPQYKEIQLELEEKYEAKSLNVQMLKNGLVIREVFSTDAPMSDNDQLNFLEKLRSRFSLKNIRKAEEFGMDYEDNGTSILISGGKMNYTNSKVELADINNNNIANNDRDIIYNYLGVPPQLMGSPTNSTYNNVESARKSFIKFEAIPTANKILNFINQTVLKNTEYTVEINLDEVEELKEEKEEKRLKLFNVLNPLYLNNVITEEELKEGLGINDIINDGKGGV